MIETLAQFGVAGLMGVLWVWERMYSRRREQQLSQAHQRLTVRDQQATVLLDMVKHNTRALVRFERTQRRTCDLLEGIRNEMAHERTNA